MVTQRGKKQGNVITFWPITLIMFLHRFFILTSLFTLSLVLFYLAQWTPRVFECILQVKSFRSFTPIICILFSLKFYTSITIYLNFKIYKKLKFKIMEYWAYTPKKPDLKETHAPQCSSQHCLSQPGHGSNLDAHQQTNG